MNLLVSYWEICLYLRRDYIERRVESWRERQEEQHRSAALLFLVQRVTFDRVFSRGNPKHYGWF